MTHKLHIHRILEGKERGTSRETNIVPLDV